ncbi:hypothetical protein, partial [Thiolapillus sp.]|uniref:hypothetical protein n=1 Tax=Thiolapillus sp. TaxID=2017437 RepID=UPI003AF4C95A
MTRTAGAQIGCQRPSRFWGLGCPKIFHEAEDTLEAFLSSAGDRDPERAVRPATMTERLLALSLVAVLLMTGFY